MEVKERRGAFRVGALRKHDRLLILQLFLPELFLLLPENTQPTGKNLCKFPFTERSGICLPM